MAQDFTQILGVDYEKIYTSVVDTITLIFLISFIITENLHMCLMNVVTFYLFGSLDNNIYIRVLKGLKMSETFKSKPREMYLYKVKKIFIWTKTVGSNVI
jgi:hypothetical protein